METKHIICIIKSDLNSDLKFDMKSATRSDMTAGMTFEGEKQKQYKASTSKQCPLSLDFIEHD